MKIIVLNLHRSTTSQELTALFQKFGKVASCDLVMDRETGQSKGFGFVEMNDVAEAEAAIAKLHGTLLANHKLRVKVADENR
ncbi:MAG: RNA-binding protein [Rickettsiales bacterium]|nr:RNA-binding protein [Rickettsiales bacterium]